MTEKRKKEEDISSETPRKKKPQKSDRLSDMIESMQKRGSPLNAHRVATRYFDSFRKERNIPEDKELAAELVPVPEKEPETEKITAVVSAVKTEEKKKRVAADTGSKPVDLKDLDESFTPSESRVYGAMYRKSLEKEAPTLRFGLKELKEITGLSDKTIRVAIHSLEKKLSLKVAEPSLGVYGRKFYIPGPEEVLRERRKAGLEIDPTTKKITGTTTAIDTDVTTAVITPINTAVDTAVDTERSSPEKFQGDALALYELYTGNKRSDEDVIYFETIIHLDAGLIEAALILTVLKGKGGKAGFSQIADVLADFQGELPEGYLEHLRDAWKAQRR